MTTNYIDPLDPALLRPGRVDVVSCLGRADADQAARLYANFYDDDADSGDATDFGERVVDAAFAAAGRSPSMAELQGYLLTRKFDKTKALADVADVADVLRVAPAPAGDTAAPPERAAPEADAAASRGRRRLTPLEVDKLVFNPQPGWEDEIGKIR